MFATNHPVLFLILCGAAALALVQLMAAYRD